MSKILGYWKDESGASVAEYALVLAIVITGLAGAVLTLKSDDTSTIKSIVVNIAAGI